MLPPDYSKAVLACYRRKLEAGGLSIDIRQLSPASLKSACLGTCRDGYDKKDEWVLKGFFEEGGSQQACLLAIDNMEIDKFRPLVYFMKGRTKNPDDKVVELVAWLIDFKDRPYDRRKDYSKVSETPEGYLVDKAIVAPAPAGYENGPQPISPDPIKEGPKIVSLEESMERRKRKRFILTITISIAFGMAVFWIWPHKPMNPRTTGSEACMFWVGDHYQAVSCAQKIDNAQVIALDSEKIKNVYKITRPDTITLNAIGSVWYAKYRGELEYYTDSGFHPLDPNLRLKPITAFMIRKYIHPAP